MQIAELHIELDPSDAEIWKTARHTHIEADNLTITINNTNVEELISALRAAIEEKATTTHQRVRVHW